MKRIFGVFAMSTVIEDQILIRLKVPRNERWTLVEFRASALAWTFAEAYVRASGIVRGRQSTDWPQPPVILNTPVEQGEDITLEFSNFAAISVTCSMHLMVEIDGI